MKIKCIIIDDEPLAIKVIKTYLKKFNNFVVLNTFNNPLDALETIKSNVIDVIFLDINMDKLNGLSFLRSIEINTNVVITTAYREYALESYDLNVLDYIVKPIPFNRFLKTINKITQQIYLQQGYNNKIAQNNNSHIFVKVDKKLIKIIFTDINYIESLKDYIMIFTKYGNFLTHKSLTSFTEELPKNKFLRIHRSFTIAIDKIKSLEGNLIEISSKRIPIGRKYVKQVKQIILDFNMDNKN